MNGNMGDLETSGLLKKTECKCGTHTQHRIFSYMWYHPSAQRKEIMTELHLSPVHVRVAIHRLRQRFHISRTCPECFENRLECGVCNVCGYEPSAPSLPLEIRFDEQFPVNHIHAGNELGSTLNYKSVGFTNHGTIVKRWMEKDVEDSLVRGVKSDVLQELKGFYPDEAITDYAGRLCIKEVIEFRTKYPLLAASKNVKKQLAENVINRMRLLYPQLSRRPLSREVTPLQ